jgi:DNA-binding HxlR family transcriptional regulator
MLLDTKEAKCMLKTLSTLDKEKSRYNKLFRQTKVSHTTLQKVLKELSEKKIIQKHDIGHMNVEYEITDKGKKFLSHLREIQKF